MSSFFLVQGADLLWLKGVEAQLTDVSFATLLVPVQMQLLLELIIPTGIFVVDDPVQLLLKLKFETCDHVGMTGRWRSLMEVTDWLTTC